MKKLHTTLLFLCCMYIAASAQKKIDLETTLISPAAGSVIIPGHTGSSTPPPFFPIQIVFKNKGTGIIDPSDTLFYTLAGAQQMFCMNCYITGISKGVNDTVYFDRLMAIMDFPEGDYNFCVWGEVRNGNTITDDDTTNNTSCHMVKIGDNGGTNGIPQVIFGPSVFTQSLNLSPNPATNMVDLGYTAINEAEVTASVSDITGREVLHASFGKAYKGKANFKMDISMLTIGLYNIKLRQGGTRAVGKLNKQ